MKADNSYETTGHNRIIKITEIPTSHRNDLSQLTIQITYLFKPNEGDAVSKAIALDHYVIPAIIKALNAEVEVKTIPTFYCDVCGYPYRRNEDDTANHLNEDGTIDYDSDEDHVAYEVQE